MSLMKLLKGDLPSLSFKYQVTVFRLMSLSYDKMDERIRKLVDLAETSDYNYVIMTGCGEEQEMWENIKQKLINK